MLLKHKSDVVASFAELVGRYSEQDFAKPTRSTIPLLDYWREPQRRLDTMPPSIGLPSQQALAVGFEHLVASLPRAKASHTDLMIETETAAIAVEGKWTEPMYATVSKWIAQGEYPDSRRRVVNHWLSMIQPFAERALSLETLPADQIVYQLLHRTASACATAGNRQAVVLYQVFDDGRRDHPDYKGMFKSFRDYLQPTSRLRFRFAHCPMKPTTAFSKLEADCYGKNKTEVAMAIREALLNHQLFEFPDIVMQQTIHPATSGV